MLAFTCGSFDQRVWISCQITAASGLSSSALLPAAFAVLLQVRSLGGLMCYQQEDMCHYSSSYMADMQGKRYKVVIKQAKRHHSTHTVFVLQSSALIMKVLFPDNYSQKYIYILFN